MVAPPFGGTLWFSTGGLAMKWICALSFSLFATVAQADVVRSELKRADLTGTNMEVIISVVQVPVGDGLPRHIHHGEEAVYVLEGATLELLDGKQQPMSPGAATINVRDVPHAGFKVIGDRPLKLLTVHIVDKGKPLLEAAK